MVLPSITPALPYEVSSPGARRSTRATASPRLARCSPIEVPTMPAPSTMASTRAMVFLSKHCAARVHAGGPNSPTVIIYHMGVRWPAGRPGQRIYRPPARVAPPRPAVLGARPGEEDAPSARSRPVDLVRRLRQARRGGARARRRRRRLDAYRRDGRALRAQHLDRPWRGQGTAPAHQEGVRRAPDDRALRSL